MTHTIMADYDRLKHDKQTVNPNTDNLTTLNNSKEQYIPPTKKHRV